MQIAIAQINPIIGDFQHNARQIEQSAYQAIAQNCDLVVFSELAITGYPPRDLLEKGDFVDANLKCLRQLVESIRGIGVICGFVDKNNHQAGNPLLNAAVFFEDGAIRHTAAKHLLPTYDVFDERRYFEPGQSLTVFDYKGQRIGLTICEDVWNDMDIFHKRIYHTDPVKTMIDQGADLIVNISASPFFVGKQRFREYMLGAIANKYKVPLVYANQVGGNDSVLFDGASGVYNADGDMIARAVEFNTDLIICDLARGQGDLRPTATSDSSSILSALEMGTRDYVTKCGFSKAVIGLSGGIDSALTACIAVRALGKDNVRTVFMPSRYTSQDNYEDTQQLADNLEIQLETIPIDAMFESFLQYLAPQFQIDDPGIAEQNIQARIRGTILMGISNQQGCLLLSTGNKSELAVGYCTLYGDMSGGLAVISDVPKTIVYDLARLINAETEIIPQRIIDKAPSAELKPDQADQDDLPPYDVLDPILKAYIQDAHDVNEIVAMGYSKDIVMDVIKRVDRNEYKRHQAAPGLKVTSKAFGYGRRYPIAQRYAARIASD